MTNEAWGVGNAVDAKAFDTAIVGKTEVELITGEHPHSRSDNRHYARFPDGRIEGFDGHRRPIRIEIEESNYLKESGLSGDEVRKGGSYAVWVNGVQILGDFTRSWDWALKQLLAKLPRLLEHPVDWTKESDWLNRKVYYDRTPATVKYFIGEQGCVVLEAEEGCAFMPPVWAKEDWERANYDTHQAKVEIDSDRIWWWRD